MSILSWPITERPREKLVTKGPQYLSDAELLALLFGSGTRGKTAVDLARDLLKQFSGLRGVFGANFKEFSQFPGLGISKYCQCQAVIELNRRQSAEPLNRTHEISHPEQIKAFVRAMLRDRSREVFACLFLDNRHRQIAFEELFQGTIDSASVYPRVVIQRALYHNATAVILTHNHPSGVAEPSTADRQLTSMLQEALSLIDVRLLDHLIVGDDEVTSFSERGLLAQTGSI